MAVDHAVTEKEDMEKGEGVAPTEKRHHACVLAPSNRFRLVWDFVLLVLIVYIAVRTRFARLDQGLFALG